MTRRRVGVAVVAGLALVILGDLAAGRMPDPYQAPPLLALGSGAPAPSAHCSAVPASKRRPDAVRWGSGAPGARPERTRASRGCTRPGTVVPGRRGLQMRSAGPMYSSSLRGLWR
jgi:hypothetical protein